MAKKTSISDFQVGSRILMPGEATSGEESTDLDSFMEDVPSEDELDEELEGQVGYDDGLDEEPELEERQEEEQEDDQEPEGDDAFSYSSLVSDLAASGILHIDEDKEYDDTPEGFQEIISDTANQRISEVISALPPTAQRIVQLAMKGGAEEDLQALLTLEDGPDWEAVDLEDEDIQLSVVEEAYRLREPEASDEEVKEHLSDLQDLGKLGRQAVKDQKYLIKEQEAQKVAIEAQITVREQAAQANYQQEITRVKNFIAETTEIAGLKLTKKDREDFLDYLTIKDKAGQTQSDRLNTYERRIQKEFLNFKNFNLGKLKQQAVSEATKEVKKQLGRYNVGRTRQNSSSGRPSNNEAFGGRIVLPGEYSND